jgi:hypothetical protein
MWNISAHKDECENNENKERKKKFKVSVHLTRPCSFFWQIVVCHAIAICFFTLWKYMARCTRLLKRESGSLLPPISPSRLGRINLPPRTLDENDKLIINVDSGHDWPIREGSEIGGSRGAICMCTNGGASLNRSRESSVWLCRLSSSEEAAELAPCSEREIMWFSRSAHSSISSSCALLFTFAKTENALSLN